MNIQKSILLAPFTTFGIGGPADYFFKADSAQTLVDAIFWAKEKKLNFFVLGLGANILVGDRGYHGLVIKNEAKKFSLYEDLLTAESGITIKELINFTCEKGLSGLEHFAGIPSTLGGALWQNLHFLSPDRKETVYIGNILQESRIMNQDSRIINVERSYFKFGYDYSILHDSQDIVLSATLVLKKDDPKIIQERINANLKWRQEKHPDYAWRSSAGSVFKKIEGYGAGRLIQDVGLKGYKIGGAKFSEKHANFIVNEKNATAHDIRALIELAQRKVKEKFNLDLQTEISFVGEF